MKKVAPFPQANNIELMFSILNDIGKYGVSKLEISSKYDMDSRQGAYYLDSLLYLGFVEKINTKYFLSQKGVDIRLTPKDKMKLKFIEYILDHEFVGHLYISTKTMSRNDTKTFISNSIFNYVGLSYSTSNRRASSIIKWFEWIDKNNS